MPANQGQAKLQSAATGANDKLYMSPAARAKMRRREAEAYKYYDDMGQGKGNCTWGPGILLHRGPCTKVELKKKVGAAEVESEFARRVQGAENAVRRNVKSQALTQAQFDALVSLTYNVGPHGARTTYDLVDSGDLAGAAANISTIVRATVHREKVVARGLIARRAEEAAPFRQPTVAPAKKK